MTFEVNMVCNPGMRDSELIDKLGGVTALAVRLGFEKQGGVQRVQNWKLRGIPARVKLQWPDIFLRPDVVTADHPAPSEPSAATEATHAA